MQGQYQGQGKLAVTERSRIKVRLPGEEISQILGLAGAELDIEGRPVTLGFPKILPLIPAPWRYCTAAWSAEASWVRVKARKRPIAARWPIIIRPIPASGAPAAMASAPSTSVAIVMPVASLTPSRMRIAWPPVMWPISCATTPWTWFTLSDASISPLCR